MTYYSDKAVNAYMSAMKSQMSSLTDFGTERFTGIILGRFFSVTHHCGYEMNRRITNEKHRAIGFACKHGDGTKVTCIRLAGMTNPLSLIIMFSFCLLIAFLIGEMEIVLSLPALFTFGAITLLAALITAVAHSVTERGQEGSRTLTAFLINPDDYYSIV